MKPIRGRIDERGRVTIPHRIREAMGLRPGTELTPTMKGRTIRLARVGPSAPAPTDAPRTRRKGKS